MCSPSNAPQAISRPMQGALLLAAGLAAVTLGVWAFAIWGDRLPTWNPQKIVAEYKAWRNRPQPLDRCVITISITGKVTIDEDGIISDCTDHPCSHNYWRRSLARFQKGYYSRCRHLDLRIPATMDGEYAAFWLDAASMFEVTTVSLTDAAGNVVRQVPLTKTHASGSNIPATFIDQEVRRAPELRLARLPSGEVNLQLPDEPDMIIESRELPTTLAELAQKACAQNPRLRSDCLCLVLMPDRNCTVEDWINITELTHGAGVGSIRYDLPYRPSRSVASLDAPAPLPVYTSPDSPRQKRPQAVPETPHKPQAAPGSAR